MKRLTALVLIAALLLPLHPVAFADDSDIFGYNVQPNVLILFDNSGSMSDPVPSVEYDPATTYPTRNRCGTSRSSTCTPNVVYKSDSSSPPKYTQYANNVASVSDANARSALSTAGFWTGPIGGSTFHLFMGNYLNLANCTSSSCSAPKIIIAKRVIKKVLDNVQGVRFGIMKFWYSSSAGRNDGAAMVAEIGTDVATIKTAIGTTATDGITQTSGTPLGQALYDGGQYFKGLTLRNGTSFPSPIQLACQPNFIILVTDGLQNSPGPPQWDVRTEATNRYQQDHTSAFSGVQNVIVDTVGFGIGASEPADVIAANDVLRAAAANGGGQFYDTNSEDELERALQEAIRRITAATFTFATPVLPTTSTTGSSRAYLAAFKSDPTRSFWQGYLKAYQRDSNGMVPVDANGVPLDSAKIWDAGQQLITKPPANRTIYTTITSGSNTTQQPFTTSNNAIKTKVIGVPGKATADQVISYIRGVDSFDENQNTNTTEDRAWKLGDIFHSTPVLVTPPILALNDSSYQTFKQSKANRTPVLIAGSNDGMLHAFRESDGVELWGFIPEDLLDDLQNATVTYGTHPYFVDGSPIAADVKTFGTWKTIVVFGLRRGGNYYYALDITDIADPKFLWSFTDTRLGETWSEPAIGRVKIGGVEKFVAFVGGGYDTGNNNNTGKAFFVISLATGQKLWEYYNDGITLDDRQYMNFSLAANPTAVDLNNDGLVDRVYIGDVGGQVWKFDVSAGATSSWLGKRLFAASPSQANPAPAGEYYPAQGIYGAPSLALDKDLKTWLFFGTGDRNHPNNTAGNRFYGIKETTTMTNNSALTETNLADVTGSDATASAGWFFRLASNEKVLAAANVFNNVVFFSTFTPLSTATCESGGGTAKLYSVQVQTGYAAVDFSTGEALTSTDSSKTRSKTIGGGIATMPVIVLTPPTAGATKPAASAVTATTNQQLIGAPVPAPSVMKQVRWWRELAQ